MTATNHVLTGALIVASVPNHYLGLFLALVSHVILDIIPHLKVDEHNLPVFVPALITDALIGGSTLLFLIFTQPANYGWLVAGGVIAASPDLLSIAYFIDIVRHRPHHFGIVQRFLRRIQWSESLPGLAVEVVWFFVIGNTLLDRL